MVFFLYLPYHSQYFILLCPLFAEEFFEAVGVVDVVIAFEHTQRAALAEAAGADEEEEACGFLYRSVS